MDQLHLSTNQCDTLYCALKHYEEYLNQPNEMAVDNTEKRKNIKELIEYFMSKKLYKNPQEARAILRACIEKRLYEKTRKLH